ncbi:hypothetical protein M9H77_09596 [Catharanthus roseus]|uniref:Uncharacterized protein n=1 Tax=Catharanthus roseus TaxID=4058 RepID=A0ACC0C134_CATRO|nr:hypothetical protein M9H77_09596 [Catharanthus roseus]
MTIFCKKFLINCLIFRKSSPDPCPFLAVYDCSSNSNSSVFWDQLKKIGAIFFGPWLVFGDFNNVLGQLDKTGGNPLPTGSLTLDLRMITRVENENNIHGIKVCRTSPSVSHLMYIDDLTIFCRVELIEAANVQSIGYKDSESKHLWLKSWNSIYQPKSFGGQGFRVSLECNKAMVAKLNWRIHTKPDTLWVQ